jgi:SagB-type dehydrogenase family enzyme
MGDAGEDAIRAYHEQTKHSVERLRQNRHFLDWEIMPRPFKVYPTLPPIPLPRDFAASTRPALAAIADPGTARGGTLDRTGLARLLHLAAGVLRHKTWPGGEIFFRAAACTGALYHIDVYVACAPLPDLDAGLYHFGPHDFALRRLRAGDQRAALIAATADEPAVAGAPVVIALTSTFWRNAWKYQARAWRHAFWDAGTLLANLLAVAAANGVAARVVLGFVDSEVHRLLDVDPAREAAVALVALGCGAAPPPPAAPTSPLGLEVLSYSEREVDYPAIREAHAASSLSSPAQVAVWRAPMSPRPDPPAPSLTPLAPGESPRQPIETVILRRGSTRVFSLEPVDFAQLSSILDAVTRGIPADALAPDAPLTDVYAIVNAVTGLTAGAYAFDRRRRGLALLRAGDFRRDAGFLGLGQELPCDAAACLFWLAPLDPALAHFGGRGYRAAQLEAAIEGGKAYLAAYTLGLGATGLTFFDDDVTAFFSPHAAGKSVMFLVAIGRPMLRRSAGRASRS